ncbi:PssD/Cps14F family polysaccharide biosynthesis glycosyltransferase [Rossellomorea marisflavi]|uniref:PssD/Cps14F family polysaccharide biosynthesis glycosyltransferase n=1 Tax=Rossellomorea marisflavi TaxID=189381 RepID=UPI00345ABEA0
MKSITLISSTGGHLSQLLKIVEFISENKVEELDLTLITEEQATTEYLKESNLFKVFYLSQIKRTSILFPLLFIKNIILSLFKIITNKPSVVISTGAGAVVPYCILAKLFGAKLIFIESYAKINSPTITGRILYKFSDRFYVQWEPMLKFYPKAIYKGGLY